MGREVNALSRLKALVQKAGTQRAAAKALGVSEPHIADLLHGRRGFSVPMLAKLGLRRAIVELTQ